MEMTNRRWFGIVALACALLAALRLPPHGEPAWMWMRASSLPETERAAKIRERIVRLHSGVSVLARRDTLLAALRSAPDRNAPLLVATAALTPAERDTFQQTIVRQAAAIGPDARKLVLGVVRDSSGPTPTRVNYRTERQFVMPASTDGESCVAIVRLGRGPRELEPTAAQGIFGPCGFYAAFGPPGPAVEAWLRERGYDVAFDAILPNRPEPKANYLAVRKSTREEEFRRWLDFSRGFRFGTSPGCPSGDVEVCAKALRRPTATTNNMIPGIVFPDRPTWATEVLLGDYVSTLLADLLAEQGRARFAKFWSSPAPDLETAFKSAFDQSTGEWTMRWMQYKYGRETRGPYISSRSALGSLLASLLVVGFSASLAYRRESD